VAQIGTVVIIVQLIEHLLTNAAIFVKKVSTLINHGDHMKQCIKTPSLFPYGRYDGCSQQFAQLAFIQAVATLLEFIIHVQGNDHAHIHVDELCG